jgi:hypothetical protein
VKNGWARRRYKEALVPLRKSQSSAVAQAYVGRVRENHEWAIASLESQYIQGKSTRASLEKLLQSHKQFEGITDQEIDARLNQADISRDIFARREQEKELVRIVGTNPDEVLRVTQEAIKNGKVPDNILGIPTHNLKMGHMREAKNLAIHDIQVREKKNRELNNVVSQQMNDHAWNLTPASVVAQELAANENLTSEQRIAHLDEFFESLDTRLKVDKKPDAQQFEDEAVVKNVLNPMIKGMPTTGLYEISEAKRTFMQEYGLRLLEDSVRTKQLKTEREKREEAVRIYLNLRQMFEAGEFEEIRPRDLPGAKKPKRHIWKFGLDEIWDKLDAKSRRKAVELLDRGATPEQLISHYKSKIK